MAKRNIIIDVDFSKKDILKKFTIKQFDNATITVNTFMDGVVYNPLGSTCKLFVAIDNDVHEQESNIQVKENEIIIDLDRNMISRTGRALAELELTDSKGVMTSSTFIFTVEEKIGEGATIPGNIEGFVAKYERLIKEFKAQVDSTVKDCNTRVNNKLDQLQKDYNTTKNEVVKKTDNKIVDIEDRFKKLTASQQQDSEVIDARDGEESLKARLDRDLKYEDGKTVKDKIAFIEGLQESQNLKYASDKGYIVCEETKNGVIDNLKLSGRTLVNLSSNMRHSIGGGATQEGNIVTLPKDGYVSYTCTDMQGLQGKTFTVKYHAPLEIGDNQLRVSVRYMSAENTLITMVNYTYDNNIKFIIPNVEYKKIIFYIQNTKDTVITQEYKITCIEGDHTQTPPGHFEGPKSVGDGVDNLEVISNNENLLDLSTNLTDSPAYYNTDILGNGFKTTLLKEGSGFPLQFKMKCTKQQDFRFKCSSIESINNGILSFYVYGYYEGQEMDLNNTSKRGVNIKQGVVISPNAEIVFNSSNFDYLGIGFYFKKGIPQNATCTILEPCISINSMEYKPHKSHKKQVLCYDTKDQIWKKPILRGTDTKQDTIEQHNNGKWYYHRRCYENIFDGSEDWSLFSTNTFSIQLNNPYLESSELICNKYNEIANVWESNVVENGAKIHSSGKLYIKDMQISDVAGFKAKLKEWADTGSPLTIVYPLAQEEVYECTPLVLDSYEGETLAMFIGGAINPKLEFEVTSHINNMVLINKNRIRYLEEKFISQLREISQAMLSNPPDYRAIAYIAYPNDFINTNEDIPITIPEL